MRFEYTASSVRQQAIYDGVINLETHIATLEG